MHNQPKQRVPYEVIVAATQGDEQATLEVFCRYMPYIKKLSMEEIHIPRGGTYYELNEDWQSELYLKLVEALKKFKPV